MPPTVAELDVDDHSTTSWGAIIAGGIASTAVSLVLLAFGIGIGASLVSPWAGEGLSATSFKVGAGLFMVAIAMLSGTVGGYMAGRLRVRWPGVHREEVFFRDTAHGFMAWALATVLTAVALGGATTHLLAGAATGSISVVGTATAGAQQNPTNTYVDLLLRREPGDTPAAASSDFGTSRGEIGRLILPVLGRGGDVSANDRSYLAHVVAARTGLKQADAERRVSEVVTQAKIASDNARKATARLALWLTASMFAGALASCLGALEGGALRDAKWWEPRWRRSPA